MGFNTTKKEGLFVVDYIIFTGAPICASFAGFKSLESNTEESLMKTQGGLFEVLTFWL